MDYKLLKEAHPNLNIKFNHALSDYSYTKTGGEADVIAFPKSKDEVKQIIDWAKEFDAPLTILGNLSNLIVKDGGIRGIVMILTDMNAISVDGHYIYAESGAGIIEVSREAYRHSLTGLEFACGIPGSVGGAVFMNAGAYEGEITDINVKIEAINREGQFLTYTNEDAEFAYRHSIFQENDNIILGVSFELQPGDQEAIKEKMDHLTELRESKQPLEYPSCGSVFKRPVGYYTGKLIQDAGLQGHRIGGAEISRKHAGFIINVGGATATDYVEMIEYIQETIWNLNSVRLETEVRIIGREAE
ncbi:MAG: UDP-N-acetylmuramate dehydrogenase [Ruoffia tabacinasalis]|uniref:UDP-N-acetylenolpyruvoylglucosamine reductase n=1 Tax=Ruoffia tabacinasalis TaxID=87458 RepID=A0ABS0LM29_9LACT|nr:UDP-N-acetylmuramate dehydrogenase [Ruoffia tabacinasalis]MBG9979147.1 UDP-N-acetylmuramate dehydrogenase [Ruoffia tabacinasalis]HBY90790.1 UDP-N-acetylmuramate dehydrogenase [Aerococcaceae bacterium]